MTGRTPLPLSDNGSRELAEWANALAGRELRAVYCGDDPTSQATGKVLAQRAEVRLKVTSGLAEVDVGLWEGLTDEQVESRFPKLFKRWVEDPASVCPPNGEPVAQACTRVMDSVHRIARKHRGSSVAVILGPLAMAATRSQLERGQTGDLHEMKTDQPVWYRVGDGEELPVGAAQ
jgi:broad specificity phosphatase PhoE